MSDIKQKIVSEIKKIYDPEIPVNIYELGLIYKIEVNEQKKVNIEMTLTSPNCPVAEELPNTVKKNVLKIPEIKDGTKICKTLEGSARYCKILHVVPRLTNSHFNIRFF